MVILTSSKLKYFSSIAAVKIGKKKCAPSFVKIFTAAIDEKYFNFENVSMTIDHEVKIGKKKVCTIIC